MLRFLAWRQLDKCINMSLRVTADIQKVSFGCQAEPGLSATVRTIVAIIGVERVAGKVVISGDFYIPKNGHGDEESIEEARRSYPARFPGNWCIEDMQLGHLQQFPDLITGWIHPAVPVPAVSLHS
ncbi:hypothetical protein [Parasphingorhabdus sp.]|uniref:hypothetical protein n=1 Tax=Parasphingorhabdus sp. TaxID=2709688 RepID=UPI003A903AEA